ncbi:hypothetical protein [Nostoc sp. FACHB-888]|uniref:hypothetical protein n=1 Tax=Nostoc sp. FACHB-888 TaxID=2692842 RepID=UPI001683541A|nr:hypothetical protein [Nostoc sp. FACHB-888]MBD2246506.1 hypothetical protein [Nostoc sp. FACHB-888]
MQSTLFTTLTATEEANLSGGKKNGKSTKAAKPNVKLNINVNIVKIEQNNVSVGDAEKLEQTNTAAVVIGA